MMHDTPNKPAPRGRPRRKEDRAAQRFLPHDYLQLLGKTAFAQIKPGDSVERNMTILFSDIRSFTALSEQMSPGETFRFITAYLKAMEPALFHANGFIDKFIGDAIMGIFPERADDALAAAFDMFRRMTLFNQQRRKQGATPIRIGIGINTGLAMAGVIGGRQWMETTVISDAVNLAARLESLTKAYDVGILISEHVLYNLDNPDDYHIRFVDRVRVKGKEQPQSVYEVYDTDPPALRKAKQRGQGLFEEALANYHCLEVGSAATLLRRYLKACPGDNVARVYAQRCKVFSKTGIHEGTGEIGMPIVWGPDYKLDHAVIDEQHRELFAVVNRFNKDIRTAESGADIEQLTAFLNRYIDIHFSTEEQEMRRHRYPLLPLQQAQHLRFKRDFGYLQQELQEKFLTQRNFMLFKIQLLLVDWLANHTMKLDKHFGLYLAARSRKQKPSRR